jgi:hypothetical protein
MPGVFDAYAVGYRELIFLSKEGAATYGTIVHPVATDAIQFITGTLTHKQDRVDRTDKTTSRTFRGRISHRVSASWSVNLYNLPSGTSGVAPDVTDALEFGFGAIKVVPDTLTTGVPTTTSLPITAAAGGNYAIGDAIGWVNALGELEATFVTAVVVDTLTVDPPLSSAPAAGATLKGSVTYKPANVLGSLTLTRILDNYEDVYPGCIVNTMQFVFPGTAEATITIGGDASTSYSSGSSTLANSPLIGDATFTVATGDGARFQPNTRVIVGSEVVLITAVAGDVLSITHAQAGTSASAHTTGDAIGPYEPPSTVAGVPVSGTIGSFYVTGIQGATRALSQSKVQTATLSVNNNAALRNAEFGKNFATGFFVKKRNVNFDVTVWLEPYQVKFYNRAKLFAAQSIMWQNGKTIGNTIAVKIPNAELNIPTIPGGGDDEVSVPMTGAALGTLVGGNDEVFYAYL